MIVTRFAPSPTGYLHIGHAFAAITAHDAAKHGGGEFLLRVEDIDATRCRPEFEAGIFEDMTWLGLDWKRPVLRQSERFAAYHAAVERLTAGHLLYPCFCTRAEIAAEVARASEAPHLSAVGPEGPIYPGTCRHLPAEERTARIAAGASYALRLDVAKTAGRSLELTFQEHGEGPNGEHGTIAVASLLFGDV
ncbi:MAG TPA: glutamate--tRNA ligase family protein, partial [Rhizomicrobium sp.]